jgi:FkbH-like protein
VNSATILDIVRTRVERRPDRVAFYFLSGGESDEQRISYADLWRRARAIAAALADSGVIGRPVILAYPSSIEYVAAFLGCLLAGALPAPTELPHRSRGRSRLTQIWADSGATIGLTSRSKLPLLTRNDDIQSAEAAPRWIATDEIPTGAMDVRAESPAGADRTAYLQYTSGSTSQPRGVMVTHHGLLENLDMIQRAFGVTEESLIVSWLPLFHDMGLVGTVLEPLYAGASCALMPPGAFLQRPLLWLESIAKYRASISGGPNFAYDLCVRALEQGRHFDGDLSCWQVAFNGAERVRPDTLRRFAAALSSAGFRSSAFHPCYGLAEATLLVSASPFLPDRSTALLSRDGLNHNQAAPASGTDEPAVEYVACGRPVPPLQVAIVDPQSRARRAEGQIGEVWVSGQSIASGYWNRRQDTERVFRAAITGEEGARFLRTGDLGFLSGGQVTITGRSKEVVIIRGRNHYPEDIERTVRKAHTRLTGACAAFSVDQEGEEQLVVVQECAGAIDSETLIANIRAAVSREHDLTARTVILVKPGSVPRTTSGKIQRLNCREAFLNGELQATVQSVLPSISAPDIGLDELAAPVVLTGARAQALQSLEGYLCRIAARTLQLGEESLNAESYLNALGIDSLQAAALRNRVEADLSVSFAPSFFLEERSIKQIAGLILDRAGEKSAQAPAGQSTPAEIPLSAAQQRLWVIGQVSGDTANLNLICRLRFQGRLDVGALRSSVADVVRRHEALRTSIVVRGASAHQRVHSEVEVPLEVIDLSHSSRSEAESLVLQTRASLAATRLDPERPPLFRLTVVRLDADAHEVNIVFSHLIADVWSVDVFLGEMQMFYNARASQSEPPVLGAPAQYRRLSESQRLKQASGEFEIHAAYWRARLAEAPCKPFPLDAPGAARVRARAGNIDFQLKPETSAAIRQFSMAEQTTPFTTLLTAFSALIRSWAGHTDVLISVPVACRNQASFESAIGCFANRIVMRADVSGSPSFRELARRLKPDVIAGLAHQDFPFDHITRAATYAAQTRPSEDPFSQLLFQFEKPGQLLDLQGLRAEREWPEPSNTNFLLALRLAETDAGITGRLTYNSEALHHDSAARLAEMYVQILQESVVDGHAPMWESASTSFAEGAPGPADAPDVGISISATFVADPILQSLQFWMKNLGLNFKIEITPYNQLFHQFVDPSSALRRNRDGVNVVLIRFEDWARSVDQTHDGDQGDASWERVAGNARTLAEMIEQEAKHAKAFIVGICPDSPARMADPVWKAKVEAIEEEFITRFDNYPLVSLFGARALQELYPVERYYGKHSDQLAHIPFTNECFASLGTMLARRVHSLYGKRYKVVALDCDNTLWKGVCAEDGAAGVYIDEASTDLQRFMLGLRERGMLLCLCSKNNEEDVRAVFESRPDMTLQWRDFAAVRINWLPKSENIRSLAQELRLDVSGFIHVDDDPVQCAEIEAGCPEMTTFRLPAERSQIPKALRHFWAFDPRPLTREDDLRSAYYRANREREQIRAESLDLEGFLRQLELTIDIRPAEVAHCARIAELTQRTNQFNCTVIRRGASQIAGMLTSENSVGLVAHVKDRFGDYGLVATALMRRSANALRVDTFLLSCRALGRRVEHQMLQAMLDRARAWDVEALEIPFFRTGKNQPAFEFLQSVNGQPERTGENEFLFRLSVREEVGRTEPKSEVAGAAQCGVTGGVKQ